MALLETLHTPKKNVRKNPIFTNLKKRFEHIELPAKLLDYLVRSNKSNIHQSISAHKATRTSLGRLGHPAWALDLVPKTLFFFVFFCYLLFFVSFCFASIPSPVHPRGKIKCKRVSFACRSHARALTAGLRCQDHF